MFRNYLTVALRNLLREKRYSFINIAGLAVGLACAILIILFTPANPINALRYE